VYLAAAFPCVTALPGVAQNAQRATETTGQSKTLLVLPFENASKAPGLDWIGESFVEVLANRMASPSLYAIARQDRVYAFDRAGLPANLHPSRATLFRIAEQMDADYIVLGSYTFDGQTFSGKAQLLDVKRLHLWPEITESGPLLKLIDIQNALAWDLLRTIDPRYLTPRAQFLASSPAIRLDAFENYIRGVVTTSRPEKINKFREAIRLNPLYTMAMMQLGKTYFAAREYDSAAQWFARVPKEDDQAREANFYAGLSYYYAGQYEKAATAFSFLAERFPLTEVYNNLGVVQARRGRKDAMEFFRKAVDADPRDPDYRFNLGLTLCRGGDAANGTKELREAVALSPNDMEARTLLDQLAGTGGQLQNQQGRRLPYERIKRNYDESSFRQLALEIQNATELRLANSDPKTHAAYHIEHGRDLLSHGFTSEAGQELREAVQLDPTSPDAHAALAQLLEATNDTASARSEAEESLRLKPSPEAFVVLAKADLRDNKLDSAVKYCDRALSLDAKNSAATELKRTIAAKLAEGTQPLQQP
jgi:tetratricopeptide (TPR) repeat protein